MTWLPNDPSRWWFLPWMSLAIAPPIVTNRVPGVTGHEPATRDEHGEQVVEADAAAGRDRAGRVVDHDPLVRRREPQHVPTGVLRRVAVRAPEATGDAATRRQVLDRRRPAPAGSTSTTVDADGVARPQPASRARGPVIVVSDVTAGRGYRSTRAEGRACPASTITGMVESSVDLDAHPIRSARYAADCRERLDQDGALVLRSFFLPSLVERVLADALPRESDAFYASSTHNVYLTPPDPALPPDHAFNRQVLSTKGLLADDQVPADSPLRDVYDAAEFRTFLCRVLGIPEIHGYADALSSINVHFAGAGRELGWHFDNSSFAVTALMQAPEAGGAFDYVPGLRSPVDQAFGAVADVLDGRVPVRTLHFAPTDLVLFRGRNALHRVTPTEGSVTRVLVVLAFNEEPGVRLSDSALATFYGRTR